MRYLNVPYAEKDQAKALGARWDAIARRWYIPQSLLDQSEQFAQWFLPEDAAILPSQGTAPIAQSFEESVTQFESSKKTSENHLRVDTEIPQTIYRPVEFAETNPNQDAASNQRERQALKLSDYLNLVQQTLQRNFSQAQWLTAEVANIQQRGGHFYLELTETDEQGRQHAKTRAMVWSRTAKIILPEFERNTGKSLEAGQKILILVNVRFHVQYGLSLQIEDIDASYSLGEMERALIQLREQLQRENRLQANKAYSIPKDFFQVAVIAPPKAAGLGDFQVDAERLQKLGLCQFFYFTSAFQGEKVATEICSALQNVQRQANTFDALVIIRGGGAKLDLQYLNQYSIAKALSELTLPVITGVGHEKDNCILDEMAALRCDTPSKVIGYIFSQITQQAVLAKNHWQTIEQTAHSKRLQMQQWIEQLNHQVQQGAWGNWRAKSAQVTPMFQLIQQQSQEIFLQKQQNVNSLYQQLDRQMWQLWQQQKALLMMLDRQIQTRSHQVFQEKQRTTETMQKNIEQSAWQIWRDWQGSLQPILKRIESKGQASIQQTRQSLERMELEIDGRIRSQLQQKRHQTEHNYNHLNAQALKVVEQRRQTLKYAIQMVLNSAIEPQLKRGFAVIKDSNGQVLTSASDAKQHSKLNVSFQDGDLWVQPIK